MIKCWSHFWIGLVVAWFALLPGRAQAVHIDLEPPGPREFVRDQAHLLVPADEQKIRQLADKLLTDKATPIIVVTIDAMAKHGGDGMRIETFATLLFDQWQIGQAKLNGQDWNTGILLLVSKDDRKARIELGKGWKREQDAQCLKIMDELIIPRFKQGEFSAGIVAGVEALDKVARGLTIPKAPTPPIPWWHYALILGGVGLLIFTVISLIRCGAGGWAWLFWGALFAGLGYLIYTMLQNSSSSGGGFSGGSFGGGSSGGGGASGSW